MMRKTLAVGIRPSPSLTVAIYLCTIATLWKGGDAAGSPPAPLTVPVGTKWYGYDGNWSPVDIRVGSPQQWLSVFPNTAGQETWVIGPGGCDGTFTCEDKRGGLFSYNQSTTWDNLGYYELGFDTYLGDSGIANYGLDHVDLNDQVIVPSQIVGVINSTEFWLGSLGLGVQESRFEGAINRLTFLSSLVENQSLIPSHSYGYTAGAYYRLKNVPSSLTLGGVDANRFVPNTASFALGPNQQPVVAINSISVSSNPDSSTTTKPDWSSNPLTLLDSSEADLFTIDSSTPFLWFPDSVCESFAQAFNLTYDDTLQLYTYPDTSGAMLDIVRSWNANFKFTIADLPGSSNFVEIRLPYAAFDLQLSFPFPNGPETADSASTTYFPLRKAGNNTQYTIGRSFLQEAYLTVDYERNNFSVSQAKFSLDALTNIDLVSITPPSNSNYTSPAGHSPTTSSLSTGAKVGIGIGIALLAIGCMALVVYLLFLRKRTVNGRKINEDASMRKEVNGSADLMLTSELVNSAELQGDKRHPTEVLADLSTMRYELGGNDAIEMPAAEVPFSFFSSNGQPGSAYEMGRRKNDPRHPAELEHSQFKHTTGLLHYRPPSPASPVYSLSQHGRPPRASVGPHYNQGRGVDIMSSGEQGISPNTISPNGVSRPPSSGVLSPVSPVGFSFSAQPAAPDGSRDTGLKEGDGSPISASYVQNGSVSRSPSRNGRIVETRLNKSGPTARQDRKEKDSKRFSWEH